MCFPDELDQMGRRRGDTSLIGVVHVDGNGIGKRIQKWLASKLENSVPDEALTDEYRKWSLALKNLGEAVLNKVTDRLIAGIKPKDNGFYLCGQPSPPRQLDFESARNARNTTRRFGCRYDRFCSAVTISRSSATAVLRLTLPRLPSGRLWNNQPLIPILGSWGRSQ